MGIAAAIADAAAAVSMSCISVIPRRLPVTAAAAEHEGADAYRLFVVGLCSVLELAS